MEACSFYQWPQKQVAYLQLQNKYLALVLRTNTDSSEQAEFKTCVFREEKEFDSYWRHLPPRDGGPKC